MNSNSLKKALILSLLGATSLVAQDATIKAPAPLGQAAAPAAATVAAPTYTDQQLLEEFGWYIGKRTGLSDLGLSPAEADTLTKGVIASMNGKDSPYEIQKIGPAMSEFIQKKQAQILDNIKSKNLGQAAAFFTHLKEDKTVTELPDGLRYTILAPGTGAAPIPSDTVTVNYTGTLIDGNVFDSSDRQGHPVKFVLKEVIPGWTEGLQKISKGGKMRLYVPPSLGYGDDGRPGIPPGSVLVFDIELVDITPGAAAAPAAAAAPVPTK
ncbi:MAG TPA: FKBP-type peptidyl-prolyl cis-trans isomerase [Opitutaceae bacterium]|jgi:FKBP-type peptidyl-prolyl cis-trans isomerase|nr:FKBP-type peptidyl-prolyl cis-trans isomerase [Opitutaceae bacterium]